MVTLGALLVNLLASKKLHICKVSTSSTGALFVLRLCVCI